MNRVNQITQILTHPNTFFQKLPNESMFSIYSFFIALFSIYTILSIGVSYLLQQLLKSIGFLTSEQINLGIISVSQSTFEIIISIATFFLMLILIFAVVGLIHLYLKLFKAKATYLQTFQLYVYAYVPTYLFAWIPFIGWFAIIWSIVLLVLGVQKTHKLSLLKALFAFVFIPLALFILTVGLLILLIGFFIIANVSL